MTTPYTVCAGTYHYGNVNVYGGGSLAFDDAAHHAQVRLGVLAGSLLSAVVGYFALRLAPQR